MSRGNRQPPTALNRAVRTLRHLIARLRRGSDCVGFFDGLEGYDVVGWAVDYACYPRPAQIEILLNSQLLGTTTADLFRDDLPNEGLQGGRFGFRFDIGTHLMHARRAVLEVRFAHNHIPLRGSPQPLTLIRDGRGTANITPRPNEHTIFFSPPIRVSGTPDLNALRREGVVFYAVRSESGRASPSVLHTLKSFRELGFSTVVINNFQPLGQPPNKLPDLRRYADMVIEQQTPGRDFGAWRTGLECVAPHLREARRAVFVNDSLIGPFQDLRRVIERFSASGTDLWGLTDSFDRTYHVQTSFFICTPDLLALPEVGELFRQYAGTQRSQAVLQGELGLSQVALAAGASIGAMCEYHELSARWLEKTLRSEAEIYKAMRSKFRPLSPAARMLPWFKSTREAIYDGATLNPQHFFWDTLIEDFGYPYLKRELVTNNPSNIASLQRLWEVLAPFDTSLIRSMIRHEMLLQGSLRTLPPLLAAPLPAPSIPAVPDAVSFAGRNI